MVEFGRRKIPRRYFIVLKVAAILVDARHHCEAFMVCYFNPILITLASRAISRACSFHGHVAEQLLATERRIAGRAASVSCRVRNRADAGGPAILLTHTLLGLRSLLQLHRNVSVLVLQLLDGCLMLLYLLHV